MNALATLSRSEAAALLMDLTDAEGKTFVQRVGDLSEEFAATGAGDALGAAIRQAFAEIAQSRGAGA